MERIRKLKQQFLEEYGKFCEWIKERPRNVVIAIICTIVIIAIVVLIIRILPLLLITGGLVLIYKDDIKAFVHKYLRKRKFPNLEDDEVCYEVTKFMHKTVCTDKPLDEAVRTPSTIHDTYESNDYRELYNGVTMLKLRFIRKNRDKDPDCEYLKIVLQSSVNARLADGYLQGFNWAISVNNTVPLIKIAMLDCSDLYIYIGILLTNSADVVNAARISDTPTLVQVADDTDPLFEGGDEN